MTDEPTTPPTLPGRSPSRAAREHAIRVRAVTKRFKLYDNYVTGPVKELLFPWRRASLYREILALRDVTFDVKPGEVVGLIGANGAGKSTLLKLIAGLLPVDRGTIEVSGKVTALLTLGVGFHSEFTGRENILYGGMLLGMSKREVLAKMESIIDFSGIRSYIDRPIRTYSAGMKARLMFSTSMSVDPDIFIVDEALATGDASFLSRSSDRIRRMCATGATVMLVSHNLQQIETLCERALVLHKGQLVFDGPTDEGLRAYIGQLEAEQGLVHEGRSKAGLGLHAPGGTGALEVLDAWWTVAGERTPTVWIGEDHELHLRFRAPHPLPQSIVCFDLHSEKTATAYAFWPAPAEVFGDRGGSPIVDLPAGEGELVFRLPHITLGDGNYILDLVCYAAAEGLRADHASAHCHYRSVLTFHAGYRSHAMFHRGTMTELFVESISVHASATAPAPDRESAEHARP